MELTPVEREPVDLNADLGEGFGAWRLGDDAAMLDVVTSANIACGFHAGDAVTMRRLCERAAERGVTVGAQVAYRDLAGFGRRRIDYHLDELRDEIIYQVGALDALARVAGTTVRYVKPHGALYNTAMVDPGQASAIVAALLDLGGSGGAGARLPVLCLPGSELARQAAAAGLRVVAEGYADRAYTPAGLLVPRSMPGAVLTQPAQVTAQAVRLAGPGTVASLCLHGDTPDAVGLARAVRAALTDAGIPLRPFA